MNPFATLFSSFVLVLVATALGVIGLVRLRARKRWQAAVDAYAEREALRDRRRPGQPLRSYSRRNIHAGSQSQTR